MARPWGSPRASRNHERESRVKIAVTGGTGFVGRHLARSLSLGGHSLVLVARGLDRRDETVRHLAQTSFVPIGIDDEDSRSEEHTSELQSRPHLVCRLLLDKKKKMI